MPRSVLPKAIDRLSKSLEGLPGIGPKTAQRLTFYLLSRNSEDLSEFGDAVKELKENLTDCSRCQIVTEENPCPICSDPERDQTKLAVVEESLDVVALEKARFSGIYHVLGGQISPIRGVSPSDLKINDLYNRLQTEAIEEVILATDPSLEGEATALYIDEQIKNRIKDKSIGKNIRVTRLARGLPVGGDLEYADELTINRALEGRNSY